MDNKLSVFYCWKCNVKITTFDYIEKEIDEYKTKRTWKCPVCNTKYDSISEDIFEKFKHDTLNLIDTIDKLREEADYDNK